MEDIKITKDAASLLKRLHAAYKKRVKDGQTKQMAVIFGGPQISGKKSGRSGRLRILNTLVASFARLDCWTVCQETMSQ